jgi:Cu/Ag efflux protein CusF
VRLWKVVALLNFTLALGVGGGYLWWARDVRQLREELEQARETIRAREAAQQSWTARGIVRSVQPGTGTIWLTHETIPGLMRGMTMGFDVENPKLLGGLAPGDPVSFKLEQRSGRLLLVAIKKESQ